MLLKDATTFVYLVVTSGDAPRWTPGEAHRLLAFKGHLRTALTATRAKVFPAAPAAIGVSPLLVAYLGATTPATLSKRDAIDFVLVVDDQLRRRAATDVAGTCLVQFDVEDEDGGGVWVMPLTGFLGLMPDHAQYRDLSNDEYKRVRDLSCTKRKHDDRDDAAAAAAEGKPQQAAKAPKYLKTKAFKDAAASLAPTDDDDVDAFAWLQGVQGTLSVLAQAEAAGRVPCPVCKKNNKIYCRACLALLLPEDALPAFPRIRLPLDLLVIKHNTEQNKSTASQAQLIAPAHCANVTYNSGEFTRANLLRIAGLEEGGDTPDNMARFARETAILYPSPTAVKLADMNTAQRAQLKRVIVLDGTWKNVRKIYDDLYDLLGVRLCSLALAPPRGTHFWRTASTGDSSHVSTIEAMYYFEREAASILEPDKPCEYLDNLLVVFAHQHRIVTTSMFQRAKEQNILPSSS